jgi:hypothetical protein
MTRHQPLSVSRPTATCHSFADLWPVLDVPGIELSKVASAQEHLAGCAYCQAQYAAYQRLDQALLQALQTDDPSRYPTAALLPDLRVTSTARRIREGQKAARRRKVSSYQRGNLPHPVWTGLGSLAAVLVCLAIILTLVARHAALPDQPAPGASPPALTEIKAVTMLSAAEGWAVGVYQPSHEHPEGEALLWHYLQGHWSLVPLQMAGSLNSISMVSASDGWAVGDAGLMLAYNGQYWQRVHTVVQAAWTHVQMFSPTDGWAITSGDAETSGVWQYDGRQWTRQALPAQVVLTELRMLSPTEGWAFGLTSQAQPGSTPPAGNTLGGSTVVLHYAKGTWVVQQTLPHVEVNAVSMVSAREGWATGLTLPTTAGGMPSTLLLHYFQGQWIESNLLAPTFTPLNSDLLQIQMLSATDGWIAASINGHAGLLHYDGAHWRLTEVNDRAADLSTLDGLFLTSPTEGWAIGDRAPHKSLTFEPFFVHFQEGQWTPLEPNGFDTP